MNVFLDDLPSSYFKKLAFSCQTRQRTGKEEDFMRLQGERGEIPETVKQWRVRPVRLGNFFKSFFLNLTTNNADI